MAHYAFLDNNNIVVDVIVGIDEDQFIEGKTPEVWYGEFRKRKCLRTSYNGNIRKNFAGIGYTYSETLDAFIQPKPYDSWVLNETNCQWEAPVQKPTDGKLYIWNEESREWVEA